MLRILPLIVVSALACSSDRPAYDASLPDGSDRCTSDDDCALGVDHTDCCHCRRGFTTARVAGDLCVTPIGETAPAGCVDNPSCDATACRCANAVRVACESGACVGLDTCPAGEILVLGHCVPPCASHADCVLAADYGSCCGGCSAVHVAADAADPCLAVSQGESSCSPAPGSCDGLGCPSPPTDCSASGSAVCLEDGTCAEGGAGGACPTGTHEMGGRCVPD
jgi:hypothetical protein